MLSILIPVYNTPVAQLVHDLHQQASQLNIPFEIRVLDDASSIQYNQATQFQGLKHCIYEVLPKNIGRSAIRNRLAQEAQYDHCLFLDCDAKLVSPVFLNTYLKAIADAPASIFSGGRVYLESSNVAPYQLHWMYGHKREEGHLEEKNQEPYFSFLSNNFVVPRHVVLQHPFNEDLKGYGYEDLLWALELQQKNIPLFHLHNPVAHLGLDNNEAFVNKMIQSLDNLNYILEETPYKSELYQHSALLKLEQTLTRWGLLKGTSFILGRLKKIMLKHLLKSRSPYLRILDVYKLYFWIVRYRS